MTYAMSEEKSARDMYVVRKEAEICLLESDNPEKPAMLKDGMRDLG